MLPFHPFWGHGCLVPTSTLPGPSKDSTGRRRRSGQADTSPCQEGEISVKTERPTGATFTGACGYVNCSDGREDLQGIDVDRVRMRLTTELVRFPPSPGGQTLRVFSLRSRGHSHGDSFLGRRGLPFYGAPVEGWWSKTVERSSKGPEDTALIEACSSTDKR